MLENDFDDIEKLREDALSAIIKLPKEKQVEMWNILHKFQLKK